MQPPTLLGQFWKADLGYFLRAPKANAIPTGLQAGLLVILLVEDELTVHLRIWRSLRADGFVVLSAGDPTAALEASRNHSGPIDLLLSEVETPRGDWLELCKTIAAERPEIKVLMMSGKLVGQNERQFIDHPSCESRSPQQPFGNPSKRCSDQFRVCDDGDAGSV